MITGVAGQTGIRIVYAVCIITLHALCANAQAVPAARDTVPQVIEAGDTISQPRTIHIDFADRLSGKTDDTVQYQFLSGNVELSQRGTFMYCDSAVVVNEKEVYAYGNVIIQKGDSLTIFA
ncbi:MAG: hypothetical protein DRI69_10150, partial [Bacteroidetes bacterium]